MTLIIGGACQGKLAYATATYSLAPEEILSADSNRMTDSVRCIASLHLRVRELLEAGVAPQEILDRLSALCRDKIVICDDIFCGIVPLDPVEREWREHTGRLLCQLAKQADCVIRMQCGIAQVIKGCLNEIER